MIGLYLFYRPIKPPQANHKGSKTMSRVTIQDLIDTLRKAAASPEAHCKAQRSYFSRLKEDSVLTQCGTACCVAGDLVLWAFRESSREVINDIIGFCGHEFDPGEWITNELGLSEVEASLAFDSTTHYQIHILLADLLEQGLRLPDNKGTIELSYNSTYVNFDCAYVGVYQDVMNLDEVLNWMRKIAE
jgi:hypothetical protein